MINKNEKPYINPKTMEVIWVSKMNLIDRNILIAIWQLESFFGSDDDFPEELGRLDNHFKDCEKNLGKNEYETFKGLYLKLFKPKHIKHFLDMDAIWRGEGDEEDRVDYIVEHCMELVDSLIADAHKKDVANLRQWFQKNKQKLENWK